ncbi:MAG: hypothetical protein WAV60_17450 [Anaerolineae bacterium]
MMNGNGMVVQLTLSPQQTELLSVVAHTQRLAPVEAIEIALTEWLERQVRLDKARQAMRELSHGLGDGSSHDVARKHDTYLYGRPAA